MQRILLPTLLAVFAFTPALAGPLTLTPESYPQAAIQAPASGPFPLTFGAPTDPAPALRVAAAPGPNLGGGFLEMLFGDPGGQQAAPPRVRRGPAYHGGQPEPGDAAPGFEAREQPARPAVSPRFMRQEVSYEGNEKPGTVIINTRERLLYLVNEDGKATR
jgi:lipoprotein-anchoring transpeptidase ErfK/SrfK